jgi:hypothetical protein
MEDPVDSLTRSILLNQFHRGGGGSRRATDILVSVQRPFGNVHERPL